MDWHVRTYVMSLTRTSVDVAASFRRCRDRRHPPRHPSSLSACSHHPASLCPPTQCAVAPPSQPVTFCALSFVSSSWSRVPAMDWGVGAVVVWHSESLATPFDEFGHALTSTSPFAAPTSVGAMAFAGGPASLQPSRRLVTEVR